MDIDVRLLKKRRSNNKTKKCKLLPAFCLTHRMLPPSPATHFKQKNSDMDIDVRLLKKRRSNNKTKKCKLLPAFCLTHRMLPPSPATHFKQKNKNDGGSILCLTGYHYIQYV